MSSWIKPFSIALAAISAFAAGVNNSFIADDLPILQDRLGAFNGWASLPHLLFESYWGKNSGSAFYRPLGLMMLGAENLIFNLSPLGYHLAGLALYALCCVLVWLLLNRIYPGWPTFAAALLFAVHPVHAEAVLTAYGQLEIATAIAIVAGLICFLEAERRGWSILWLLLSGLACLIALGFKEIGIVLPLLALISSCVLSQTGAVRGSSLCASRGAVFLGPTHSARNIRWACPHLLRQRVFVVSIESYFSFVCSCSALVRRAVGTNSRTLR